MDEEMQIDQIAQSLFVHVQESAERLRSAVDSAYAVTCGVADMDPQAQAWAAVDANLRQLQASAAQDEALFRAFLGGHVQAQTKALERIAFCLQLLVDK